MDWIQGDKFKTVADYMYAPVERRRDDYCRYPNTLNFTKLKDGHIIYTHTLYIASLFRALNWINKKVYVISHNSDIAADILPPDNVIHWWSQNVDIEHERVSSIPIGLQNNRWCPNMRKKEKMLKKLKTKKQTKNLVYANFQVKTYFEERSHVQSLFWDMPWVTNSKFNNNDFDSYLGGIYSHKFVLCPRGNGLDTHRFWETLYMKSIPIVKRDRNNIFYNDLPVVYVNEWEEVTLDLLDDAYTTFSNFKWDESMLTFEYWKNKIINEK